VAVRGRRGTGARVKVSVRSLDGVRGVNRTLVERAVAEALRQELSGRVIVEIVYADDGTMRRLNRDYAGGDEPTDVLAFPSFMETPDGLLLGEVVVNRSAARRSAAEGGGVIRELLRYVVHGVLHLAGYDDHDEGARRSMWRKQEEVLKSVMRRR